MNDGQEPPLFDGEVAVLVFCWHSQLNNGIELQRNSWNQVPDVCGHSNGG